VTRSFVLEARGLAKRFRSSDGRVATALDGASLALAPGESLGVIGESGGGKSTLARALLGFVAPDEGDVRVWRAADAAPHSLRSLHGSALRDVRRSVQMVFQDPVRALDPRRSARAAVAEALEARGRPASEARGWLERAGLPAALDDHLPSALSGGERQRVVIARALAAGPEALVLDEPTAALDGAVRAQLLDLLASLRRELGLALLWISHDLDVVFRACDRVAVLYLGRIVEEAPASTLARGRSLHPYTARLLAAEPTDALADARAIPGGCRFHPACPRAERPRCEHEDPVLEPAPGDAGHRVACPVVLRGQDVETGR